MYTAINRSSRLSVLFTLLLLGLISCQKEVSLEVPGNPGTTGSTAVFALVPDGSNCSDAKVTGNFYSGTALGANAKITVTVNVTKTGTWICRTAKVNGFEFVGGGEFTVTGSQAITLYGIGTPAADGISNFSIVIASASCVVPVSVINNGPINSDIYYKATIDGVNYLQTVTDQNGYEAGSGLGGVDDVAFGAGIYPIADPAPAGSTSMGIDKGIMHGYQSATDAAFKAFFAIGDHPYAPPGLGTYDNGNGVVVGWGDPQGGDWSSHHATLGQAGSTFKIISVEDAYDIRGIYYIKVKMQFSCKLYNKTTGAVKQLTNGEMVAYFGKI